MQMFVKSLFFSGGHNYSSPDGDRSSPSSSPSESSSTTPESSQQSQGSDSSSTPYPSSDPSTFASLSTSGASGTTSGASGSGSGSGLGSESSSMRSGSVSGSTSSGSHGKSHLVSSSPSQQDSTSSHSSLSKSKSKSKSRSRSRSQAKASLPPLPPSTAMTTDASGARPPLDHPPRVSSSSPASSSESSTSSMSVSPAIPSPVKESVPLEDESEATNGTSGSDQGSLGSGHHRHSHQRPLLPAHFQQRKQAPSNHPGQRRGYGRLLTPPPPPRKAPTPISTIDFLNACPSYYQIEAVGRLVALQFLIEHQLVYLPKLDQFFLGNRMYKIPTRTRGDNGTP